MKTSSTYLSGLDGLRAIAVGLVLLFHAKITGFGGGYIGVDVFFAISGFIITRQLIGQLDAGKFSLISFWKRRVARLFPAMLIVVIATLIAAFFIFSSSDFSRLGKSSIYASMSLSNFFFLGESGYFDSSSYSKPLLHTWSLAVEEQFYVLWPIMMVLFYMAGKRMGLIIGIAISSVISLAASLYFVQTNPSAVFFMMPFRIFQFGLGALVALIALPKFSPAIGSAMCVVGTAIIIALAMIVDATASPFWLQAIAPIIASLLIFAAIDSPFSAKVLGCKPMTFIGQRAYSIYLVHWPLMVFYFTLKGTDISLLASLVLIAISVVAGVILYRIIETPLRFSRATTEPRKGTTLWLTGLMTSALVAVSAHIWTGSILSIKAQNADPEVALIEEQAAFQQKEMLTLYRNGECAISQGNNGGTFNPETCLAVDRRLPTLFLIGDSFANDTYVGLTNGDLQRKISVAQANYNGCWPIDYSQRAERKGCKDFHDMRVRAAMDGDFDSIMLASSWGGDAIEYVEPLIRQLVSSGKPVFVVGYRAAFTESIPRLISIKGSVAAAEAVMPLFLDKGMDGRNALNDRLKTIVENNGAIFIDVLERQCSERTCRAVNNNRDLLYRDTGHLTKSGASQIYFQIKPALEEWLATNPRAR